MGSSSMGRRQRRLGASGSARRLAIVLAASALLSGCASAAAAAAPRAASSGGTRAACMVVPFARTLPAKGVLLGVNLDWGNGTLARYASTIGRRPAVATNFVGFPLAAADRANLTGAAKQVRSNGGVLLVTLEPHDGLAAVTAARARSFAARLAAINATGVPVVVRFAHEMNGSWYPWGEQPKAYRLAFRTLAAEVHARAIGTAMMWAPNYGGGYPFAGGRYEPKARSADLRRLDTDHDGRLTGRDDPYAPYYPGDDAVDWVGMSLYHWGSTYPWGANQVPEPGKFASQLTGTYTGSAGDDRAVPDFYARYAAGHDKPLAITETAALYVHGGGGPTELTVKRAWWRQVLSPATLKRFPRLRMINWFDWDKREAEVGHRVDWTVSSSRAVADAFVADLPSVAVGAGGVASDCR